MGKSFGVPDFLTVGKEGLGWDAAPVQADAADVLLFDECDVGFRPGGKLCGGFAGGPGSDNDKLQFTGTNFWSLTR